MYRIRTDELQMSAVLPVLCAYSELKIPGVEISFCRRQEDGFEIKREGNAVRIAAPDKKSAAAAVAALCAHAGEDGYCAEKKNTFRRLGMMLDAARNAVPTVENLKREIVNLVLLGYGYLEVYTEDCFEVNGEPLFGYMRGRYGKNELKELAAFADALDFELVPCIQTLAHISRIFQHYKEYYFTCRDVEDILLVDEPRTYRLIENMISTAAECFTSRNINIGMDEAFLLGTGEFLRRHGYEAKLSVFARHARKVVEICKKYGFTPSLWGDMIYTGGYSNDGAVDAGLFADILPYIRPICWGYSGTDEEFAEQIEKVSRLTPHYSFAGGAWKWVGFTPLNEFSVECIARTIQVCRRYAVSDYMLTTWGDDGGEASYRSVYPSVVKTALLSWNREEEANAVCSALYGYTFDELMLLDLPNKLYREGKARYANPSKYFLYEDVLLGISETQAKPSFREYYTEYAAVLKKMSGRKSAYSYLFETLYRLCAVLEEKSTLRIDVRAAYDAGDRAEMGVLCGRIRLVEKRVRAFYRAFRAQWEAENKPFGFEVQDARLGGLMQRLGNIARRLQAYADGKTPHIAELDEKRVTPAPAENDYDAIQGYNKYVQNVTYGYF